MRFFISLATCPQCGTRVDPEWLALEGAAEAWAMTGECRRCRTPLAFAFVTDGNPIAAEVRPGELGGAAASEIISPGRFVAEIDRLVPLVRAEPSRLALDEWTASRDANARLRTCLAELAKFLPAGAAAIPDDALAPDDRADRARRPERYTRAWIDEQRARCEAVLADIVADLPRIDALQRRARPVKRGAAELDTATLRAHEAWVRRGKTGKGRLVLAGVRAVGDTIGAAELSGAKLDGVDFTDIDLSYATLDGAELVDASCERANLTSIALRDAVVRGGSFAGAAMALAKLERAVVERTSFAGADLDRSQWQGARVTGASFERARFGNAALDDATFTASSFQRADLSPTTPAPHPTTRGARFEDCDLRGTRWDGRDLSGASFIRCKLDGSLGPPAALDGLVIEEPDLSPAGDGSVIGIAADVIAMWRAN